LKFNTKKRGQEKEAKRVKKEAKAEMRNKMDERRT